MTKLFIGVIYSLYLYNISQNTFKLIGVATF